MPPVCEEDEGLLGASIHVIVLDGMISLLLSQELDEMQKSGAQALLTS